MRYTTTKEQPRPQGLLPGVRSLITHRKQPEVASMSRKWFNGYLPAPKGWGRFTAVSHDSETTRVAGDPSSVAKEPFSDPSKGDCTLRSSDGVDFNVLRALLCLASSIFADMFGLPQPSEGSFNPSAHNSPVIDLSEDAETIEAFLRCIYPVENPTIKTFDLACKLAQAAEKYFASESCFAPIRTLLQNESAVAGDPIKAYALAWRLGLKKGAIFASRYTFATDLTSPNVKEDLLDISGDFEAILALHELRSNQAEALNKASMEATLRWGHVTLCSWCRSSDTKFEKIYKALSLALCQAGNYYRSPTPGDNVEIAVNLTKVLATTCGGSCRATEHPGSTLGFSGSSEGNSLVQVKAFSHEIKWSVISSPCDNILSHSKLTSPGLLTNPVFERAHASLEPLDLLEPYIISGSRRC